MSFAYPYYYIKEPAKLNLQFQGGFEGASNCPELDACVSATITAAKDLSRQLAQAALHQAQDLSTATKQGQELVTALRQHALVTDPDRLHHTSNSFHDSIDHILEVTIVLLSINIGINYILIFNIVEWLNCSRT